MGATLVQKGSGAGNTTAATLATYTYTLPSASTAGTLLLLGVSAFGGSADTWTTPTGWTLITSQANTHGSYGYALLYAYPNNPGGITSVVVTAGIAQWGFTVGFEEWSGMATSSTLDAVAATAAAAKSTNISPSVVTSNANDLIIAFTAKDDFDNSTGGTYSTTTAGYTQDLSVNDTHLIAGLGAASASVASSGTQTMTEHCTASSFLTAIIAGFKIASSSGPVLAGEADGVGGASATVTVAHPLVAEADGVATTSAVVTVAHPLVMESDSLAGATAALTISHPLVAESDGVATATAALQTTGVAIEDTPLDEDFSSYLLGTTYTDGEVFGNWTDVFGGGGTTEIVSVGAGQGLNIQPQAATSSGQTFSSLTTSNASFSGPYTLTADYETIQQLRTGSAPNAWEVGWLLWNYTSDDSFYNLVLKPNGWEIDKEYLSGVTQTQQFLASGSTPTFAVGASQHVIVTQSITSPTSVTFVIQVEVGGTLTTLATVTDDGTSVSGAAYLSGQVGLYDEDSQTHYASVVVTTPVSANGVATASATLTVGHALVGEADGVATTTATLTVAHTLVGESDGVATATAALTDVLAGTAAGVAGASASLTVAHPLGATSAGIGGASAALTVAHPLVGESDGVAGAFVALTVAHALSGEADGVGGATAALTDILAGAAAGVAGATATLTVAHPLVAEADGHGGASATLTVAHAVVAEADGVAGASATLTTSHALVAESDGVATARATVTVAHALVATAAGVAGASFTMGANGPVLVGESDGVGGASAVVTVAHALIGESDGVATATAAVTVAHALVAESDGVATAAAALSVSQRVVGEADGVAGASLTLTVAQVFVGEADGVATATVVLTISHPFAGEADGRGGASAFLTVAQAFVGESDGGATAVAVVTIAHAFSGEADGLAGALALLGVRHSLSGEADGVSGASATLIMAHPLVAEADGVASATATLTVLAGPRPTVAITIRLRSGVVMATLRDGGVETNQRNGIATVKQRTGGVTVKQRTGGVTTRAR